MRGDGPVTVWIVMGAWSIVSLLLGLAVGRVIGINDDTWRAGYKIPPPPLEDNIVRLPTRLRVVPDEVDAGWDWPHGDAA